MDADAIEDSAVSLAAPQRKSATKKRNRSEIEKLILHGDRRVTFVRKSNTDGKSPAVWKCFYHIHVDSIRQGFFRCDNFRRLIRFIIIHGTNGLKKHIQSCSKLTGRHTETQSRITTHCAAQSGDRKGSSRVSSRFTTQLVETSAEYCALDGRPFESIAGVGFQRLVPVVFDAGRSCGTSRGSIDVRELLPSPTTV